MTGNLYMNLIIRLKTEQNNTLHNLEARPTYAIYFIYEHETGYVIDSKYYNNLVNL